ncbi:universal stress protein [Streptomyces sp. NBC_01476]|uniref:universal stress protein n=1 Tax=Streptomyces sp. NBC_01476 TaxID=2903881 RepID=UPI002E311F77|nr:universal stress protein [Streptomyces sp. NBC_01476]
MRKPLIVGVDGSDSSLRALDWAVREAEVHEVGLRLVHASRWEQYERALPDVRTERPTGQIMSEHIVGSAGERVARLAPDLPLTVEVLTDDPVSALVQLGQDASALVVGHRGRGGVTGLLLGSTSLAVAAHADCPVVVVRGSEQHTRGDLAQVTVGIGAGGESSAATAFAFEEAQAHDAELVAVRAWRRPAYGLPDFPQVPESEQECHGAVTARQTVDEALEDPSTARPKVATRSETPEGSARDALLKASETTDLLVVGARRRQALVGMQLGPVSHALLHHASCPVAVVPQHR